MSSADLAAIVVLVLYGGALFAFVMRFTHRRSADVLTGQDTACNVYNMSTETATETQTLIAKCTKCGELSKVEREVRLSVIAAGPFAGRTSRDLVGGYSIERCQHCAAFLGETKVAKLSKIKCTDKCTSATGPACSCECGGKNHGGH